MTRDNLKKIVKALKVAVNLCPKDQAGYKELLEAKDIAEKELEGAGGVIVDGAQAGAKVMKDMMDNLFGGNFGQHLGNINFNFKAGFAKTASPPPKASPKIPCTMYEKHKKTCNMIWKERHQTMYWCKDCRKTYG